MSFVCWYVGSVQVISQLMSNYFVNTKMTKMPALFRVIARLLRFFFFRGYCQFTQWIPTSMCHCYDHTMVRIFRREILRGTRCKGKVKKIQRCKNTRSCAGNLLYLLVLILLIQLIVHRWSSSPLIALPKTEILSLLMPRKAADSEHNSAPDCRQIITWLILKVKQSF